MLAQVIDNQLATPIIQLDESSTWKSPTNGATYIIITHPNFYSKAEELAAYRTGKGETTVVVKTEDIYDGKRSLPRSPPGARLRKAGVTYDEFNGGIIDPRPFEIFWSTPTTIGTPTPVYAVLIGKCYCDTENSYK